METSLSKTRADRAGDRLRHWIDDSSSLTDEQLGREVAVVSDYRKAHAYPLTLVAANLRYYVAQHSSLMIIGQRLKRLPTIIDKLAREPGMKLSRMHDIGGCRAVVESEEALRAIVGGVERQSRWDIVRRYDYIEGPKPESGYRAYHVIVRRRDRLIEVQLRTVSQHAWAELIESSDRRQPGLGLKEGRAPKHLVEYYRLGASLLSLRERGQPVDDRTVTRFRELHRALGNQTEGT